ncbi:hypothetical protein [Streptomonospora arabica]|uniref:Uncharacterized protein n=1 Tax=Streptomonospora arabica TaxID=412417 RepID=A0ABV9SGB0_9ACTN
MLAAVTIDGQPAALTEDDAESVQWEFDPDGCGAQYRCRACGSELAAGADGWEDERGESRCRAFEPATDDDPDDGDGPHDPETIPLGWCNHAGITADADADAITLAVSVGDPRGQFELTIRRVPADAPGELAGCLVMHVPYPGEPGPHVPLRGLHPGTYVLEAGRSAALRRD